MLRRFANHFDDMALAIVIWMCTLPVVSLLVFPYFGLQATLLVALGLLLSMLVICWKLCSWKLFKS